MNGLAGLRRGLGFHDVDVHGHLGEDVVVRGFHGRREYLSNFSYGYFLFHADTPSGLIH